MSIAVQSPAPWNLEGRGAEGKRGSVLQRSRTCRRVETASEDAMRASSHEDVSIDQNSSADAGAMENESEKMTYQKKLRKEKLAFVIGVVHFWVCVYWLGSYPHTFYKLYSLEAFVLFPLRWKSFRKMKMHYYMFDFCYLANLLLLVFLWIFPKSSFLFKVSFAYNSGPLAWAIVMFKNSMVYHNLSEVTTLFMHWYPMMVSWTLRWYPDSALHGLHDEPTDGAVWFDAKISHLLLWPMAPYIAWAVFYYLKLFVVSSKKIQTRGYQTLYSYMLEDANFNLLKQIVYWFSPPWRPLAYMFIHLSLVFSSLLGCILWWNSFWAHSAWLAIAAVTAAWNGASYYFY